MCRHEGFEVTTRGPCTLCYEIIMIDKTDSIGSGRTGRPYSDLTNLQPGESRHALPLATSTDGT